MKRITKENRDHADLGEGGSSPLMNALNASSSISSSSTPEDFYQPRESVRTTLTGSYIDR
jgi:hypothetical protein